MTTPPQREPLDAEERYVKRLLDSLPQAGPSPGLDARILGQARRALEHPASRRRFPGRWGLGAAAAAVLAVALWWPATRMLREPPAAAPAEPTATEAPRDAAPAAPALAPTTATEATSRPPEDWLAEIERLRADGEVEQARDSLRRFRERFPKHPIPEPLRKLLPERE